MKNKLKRFAWIFVLIFAGSVSFAQSAVDRAYDLLTKELILENYEKAYSYSLFLIDYYEEEKIPDDYIGGIRNAISGYGKYTLSSKQYEKTIAMESFFPKAPDELKNLARPYIDKAQKYLEEQREAEKVAAGEMEKKVSGKSSGEKSDEKSDEKKVSAGKSQSSAASESPKSSNISETKVIIQNQKNAELESLLNLMERQYQQEIEEKKSREEQNLLTAEKLLELEKNRQVSDEQYREDMGKIIQDINEGSEKTLDRVAKNNNYLLMGLGGLLVLFMLILAIVVITLIKNSRANQKQLQETLWFLSNLRNANPSLVDGNLPLSLQVNKTNQNLLSDKKFSDEDLVTVCKNYGEQIDRVTGRKNVTKIVAEFIYGISKNLGYSDQDSLIFYMAAYVYDIGFLSVDEKLLTSQSLTDEQYKILQGHTHVDEKQISFVDKKYRKLFLDAITKHHENLDGSGYPDHLKGDQIPYIARAIHVVESFVSLISSRNYKEIHDKNYAMEDLKNKPNEYDQRIVSALDSII